jgi:MYXO-CTERM domain-containing protein
VASPAVFNAALFTLIQTAPASNSNMQFLRFTVLLLALATHANAAQLTFSGYSYSLVPSGGYPDSGGELTNGVANGLVWPANLSPGDSAYLVGWDQVVPTITFNFAAPVTVTSVSAFFADSDGSAGVGLPSTVTLGDGGTWYQAFLVSNPAGSGTTVESVFNGFSVTTDTLTLTFTRATQWTMLSEVQAFGTNAIPEPATSALALGAASLGLLAFRRRRSSK